LPSIRFKDDAVCLGIGIFRALPHFGDELKSVMAERAGFAKDSAKNT
jgi:hypothetical protein